MYMEDETLDSLQKVINPTKFKIFFTKKINERLENIGLTEGQVFFLIALDRSHGHSLKELTDEVGVHKSLTTRAVRSLIDNGFAVDMTESGKEYSLVLTEKGKKAKKDAAAAVREVMCDIFRDLDESDVDDLIRIMGKIHARIESDGNAVQPESKTEGMP